MLEISAEAWAATWSSITQNNHKWADTVQVKYLSSDCTRCCCEGKNEIRDSLHVLILFNTTAATIHHNTLYVFSIKSSASRHKKDFVDQFSLLIENLSLCFAILAQSQLETCYFQ